MRRITFFIYFYKIVVHSLVVWLIRFFLSSINYFRETLLATPSRPEVGSEDPISCSLKWNGAIVFFRHYIIEKSWFTPRAVKFLFISSFLQRACVETHRLYKSIKMSTRANLWNYTIFEMNAFCGEAKKSSFEIDTMGGKRPFGYCANIIYTRVAVLHLGTKKRLPF